MNNIDIVKLSRLKRIVRSLEIMCEENNKEDIDITFEFLIGSCFPSCYSNVQKALQHQYTLGYIEGTKNCGIEDKD